MAKSKYIIIVPLLLVIFLLISTTNVSAEMPDTTPRMPRDIVNSVFSALPRMPRDLVNSVFGVLPKMPDTTPVMPDILRFLANMLPSGIRKFLAPPSPSNLPQPLGQWQQEPTKKPTPTPTLPPGATIQSGPYIYKPDAAATKAGVPSFIISAPSGWARYPVSGTTLARFESQQIDTETVKGGEITSNAVIIVRATDSYENLDSFVNEYKASGTKAKNYQLLSSSNDKLEFKFQTKIDDNDITIHELDYLFFKDGISFLVKGYASDSAWSQHTNEIRSALNSFRFK